MANAQMQHIIAELRAEANGRADGTIAYELRGAARPFAPRIRAAVLNIPVKGLVPYNQPPGLRARIARCIVAWSRVSSGYAQVGLAVDVRRMPPGQYSLPLYMEGVKWPWRHPLFGNRQKWFQQGNAPHPYFYNNVAPLGPASRRAIDRAIEQIARAIS